MKLLIAFFSFALVLSSCKTKTDTKPEIEVVTETPSESENWIYLFDGVTTNGWRAYNGDSLPPGWVVKDSVLTFDTELGLEQDYTGGKDIIYGLEEFDNFELYVEWKLPEGGNSGIFYHLKEGIPNAGPPNISPEYQLIDDENYANIHDLTAYNLSLGHTENPAALQPLQQTASDYAMHVADPEQKILNPVGEWNSSKIVFTPEQVEHWLNGKKVLSFVPWSKDWYERKNSGKWKDEEYYGKFKSGYIGFQDHSSPIWFRNIKIRKL
ncbi:MAG: DUF1080 domain-containing protein [Arenibacter troitsensis]|nr:DUF1080 domain-containing protein [Arenibacter troitsensis]